jgi:YspA, cpYpsA-related SLOG family
MRILITGDRFWQCHVLASGVLRRLIDRYGIDLVIVHGDATGVDESFGTAAKGLGLDEDDLRAKAGKLTDDEIAYVKTNPAALKLLIAMMATGYGTTETEGLLRQVTRRKKAA